MRAIVAIAGQNAGMIEKVIRIARRRRGRERRRRPDRRRGEYGILLERAAVGHEVSFHAIQEAS